MKITAIPFLAGALFAGALSFAVPASADVFSSQSFGGEDMTLDALPGVNLDVSPGAALAGNCAEVEMPAFSAGRRNLHGTTGTECRFGNFSITTTQSSGMTYNPRNVYADNPPPWAPRWQP